MSDPQGMLVRHQPPLVAGIVRPQLRALAFHQTTDYRCLTNNADRNVTGRGSDKTFLVCCDASKASFGHAIGFTVDAPDAKHRVSRYCSLISSSPWAASAHAPDAVVNSVDPRLNAEGSNMVHVGLPLRIPSHAAFDGSSTLAGQSAGNLGCGPAICGCSRRSNATVNITPMPRTHRESSLPSTSPWPSPSKYLGERCCAFGTQGNG